MTQESLRSGYLSLGKYSICTQYNPYLEKLDREFSKHKLLATVYVPVAKMCVCVCVCVCVVLSLYL